MYGIRTAILDGSNVDEADIELRSAKDVEYIEALFLGCRRSIRQQDKNYFREEFPQPLTVQGEALSFSVHWKKWYSFCIPALDDVRINVREVLSDSRSHKFQTERNKLDITIGLSSDRPSADVVPAQDNPTPPNIDSLRPTTEALLDQCPRFRILVIGQPGVGKSMLIHRTFGIEKASARNLEPGPPNIEAELISPQNNRFVLHLSNGFEPGGNDSCDTVQSFITDRRNREHVKDQLHAVWLCFRIPIKSHGDRLLEDDAETFLQNMTSVLENIPTMVVFTKYDKLLAYMAIEKEENPEVAAEQYLQKYCIDPIAKLAGNTDLSYVAVSSNPGLARCLKQLTHLTYQKVTERFMLQTDKPSPVSTVFLMAQKILPDLKIPRSIDVGRQRYWRMLTSGANFKNHTINECLAIIHTNIVCIWDFDDPFQYLYSDEFRGLMMNLAGTIDESTLAPRLTHVDTTGATPTTRLPRMLLAPLVLPFKACLGVVHWTRQSYQQLPNVHHQFMIYIVDLVHILEILFLLMAYNNKKKLTRGAVSSAFNSYYDSQMRHNTHRLIKSFDYKIPGRDTVLDKIIPLVGTSPIDNNEISRALGNIHPVDLAQDEWLAAGLQETIALRRSALQLTPPGHPGRFLSLVNLSNSLHERFIRGGTLADLHEIIAFRRAASECTAPTPSDRCTLLLNLADSLREKYQRLGLDVDLAEAIKYARAASVCCPSEQEASCRDCVASCVELKVNKPRLLARTVQAIDSGVEPSGVKHIVQDIIAEVTQTLPLRLLNTYTGVLCDRDAQISCFQDSAQYDELQSSTYDSPECKQSIRKTVSKYFGYTTLSHRWGTGEPLLRDIQGHDIYDLDGGEGLAKLQKFCTLTLRHGYRWAWSDTCCIDKDSSLELQEAIGSMFSWYRKSALTIVHLSDVSGTTSFSDSIWFKRGWTLQELLASPRVLFYTQDWSLYMKCASPNHKTESAILTGLQEATGIEKLQLEKFSPGIDNARSKLQWASARHTTRAEDIAYSLFGIFRLSLPALYGETAQDALGRLLREIVSRSGDVSVLDWVGEASSSHSCFPTCLAPYGKAVSLMQSVPSGSSTHNDADLKKGRELYNILAQLPPPRFLAGRLVLPCIVHRVMRVNLLETSSTTSYCHYELIASGLAPLKLEMKSRLQDGSGVGLPFVLVRPWSPKLLDLLVQGDVPGSLLEWLRQPFNALLLRSSLHTEYKRVASDCSIIASVEDLASVVNPECRILEIV